MLAPNPASQRRRELIEFLAYFAASAVALGVDYGCYWLLATRGGLSLGAAAAAGYMIGLAVAYVLMSFVVFPGRWLSGRRGSEAVLFALSGLLGLVLTYFTATLVARLSGGGLHVAKLAAVAVSFLSVFLFRKLVIYRG